MTDTPKGASYFRDETGSPIENEQTLPEGYKYGSLVFVLATLSWIGPFSIDTYLPSLPSIGQSLGATAAQVQQTMTAFLAVFAFMSLWHGAISDAYGRRRFTLITLFIFTLASVGCALANSFEVLLFFRAMQGATAGAGTIVGRAVVRDVFEGAAAQKLMSHVATIFTLAPILSPVVGGWLQIWFGWRAVFAFLVLLSLFLLFCSWRWLPETLPPVNRQSLKVKYLAHTYWKVLTTPAFVLSTVSIAFYTSGLFIYIMGAPQFLMRHLKLSETDFLWLFGPMSVGMVIGAWISGRVAGKISGNQTVFIGFAVMTVAAIGNVLLNMFLAPMVPWTIVPLLVYVLGMAIAMPSMTLMGLDLFPDQRGLAASCQGFIMVSTNSVVSAFVPMIWGTTLSLALTEIVLLFGALLCLVLYIWSMNRAWQTE